MRTAKLGIVVPLTAVLVASVALVAGRVLLWWATARSRTSDGCRTRKAIRSTQPRRCNGSGSR